MKKIQWVISFVVFALSGYSQNLHEGLVLYYPFDGNGSDLSGNELHGTLYGPQPAEDRFGSENSALYFNGEAAFIDLPNNPLLKPPLPITFSFWIRTESDDEFKNKFFATDFQYDNYSGCWIALDAAAKLTVHYGGNLGGAGVSYRRSKISGNSIPTGEWIHIVGILRGPQDMSIYLNGVEETGIYTGTLNDPLGYSISIGKIGCTPGQDASPFSKFFLGTMDDFAMWDRDLTEDEVIELFNNGIAVSDIPETSGTRIILYPNPCHHSVTIDFGTPGREAFNLQLFRPDGNAVLFQEIRSGMPAEIGLKDLNPGLYLYTIHGSSSIVKSGKLVVN